MSERPTVSGKSVRGITMSMCTRGRGRSPRIPVNIQPVSTRVLPAKRPYEESSSDEEAEWEEQHTSVTPQLTAIGRVAEPGEPATEAPVRIRGRTQSKGGVSFTKARGSNKATWWVSYRGTRRHYYTEEAAEAALALFQTDTICASCERPIPHECSACGHREGDAIIEVAPVPAAAPIPVPVIPVPAPVNLVNPDPVQIRCRAIAPGVLSVTINGVTFTTRGEFEYP
jgi:hypothetical protein